MIHREALPFFSVILCTYNRYDLLPRALDSLLKQTFTDFELIIVDDGSTDDTFILIQSYADKLKQLRYLWHSNRGTGFSRNVGIKVSSGLFVTFLDSDDEYRSDHLEVRRLVLLDHPSAVFIEGGVEIIGSRHVADYRDPSRLVSVAECSVGGTFVIRRDVLNACGGFDNVRYAEDTILRDKLLAFISTSDYTTLQTDYPSYIYHRETPDSLCTLTSIQSSTI